MTLNGGLLFIICRQSGRDGDGDGDISDNNDVGAGDSTAADAPETTVRSHLALHKSAHN